MKKRLRASYTVEAACVMAILLWTVVSLIGWSYQVHDQVKTAFVLHEMTERYRHGEGSMKEDQAAQQAAERAGRAFSGAAVRFSVSESGNIFTGKTIRSQAQWNGRGIEIKSPVFEPENFLRMLTLISQEE